MRAAPPHQSSLPSSWTTSITQIDYSANYHPQLRVSPNGRQVATVIESDEGSDIWIYDVERGTRLRLTSEGSVNQRPVWTADGAAVIFRSNRTGDVGDLFSKLADGTGEAQLILDRDGIQLHISDVRRPRPSSTSAWRSCVTIGSGLYRLRGILPPVVSPESYHSGWNGLRGSGQLHM